MFTLTLRNQVWKQSKKRAQKLCFVLMDYLMPDMDGVEAIRQIKFVTSGTDGNGYFWSFWLQLMHR